MVYVITAQRVLPVLKTE